MAYDFHPFEVTAVHIVYVGLGLFICIFSYLSLFIKERLYLGEAPIAAAFGVIVGPVAIGLFNPAGWGNEDGITPGGHTTDEITLEIMRVTIALSVFAIGVELPKKYLLRHWKSIAILLGPVMAWGWLISAAFIYALIPGLDFLNSLVVAACVSPTDPILAQAVVGGPWAEKHVPAHVRHMLMCESGCNDGAAFPFLYLALYLTQNRDNTGHAIAQWFYETWAYEIILGTILGALIGYLARKFMRFSERHKLIDRESFVAQYISLAIASMGVNVLLGSDDLLAAFACGTAFAWDGWFTKQTEDSNFSNIVDLLFNIATFIYIGALVPWHSFADASIGLSVWRLVVLAICVLLTKRLPIILALWKFIPDVKTFREAVFSGHFGPMGVGAIFIATLGRTLMPEEVANPPETSNDVLALTIQPIVYFFVVCSILVHGFTVPFFAFGKNARRRAHTLTRTWSRNPSMRDDEPSWMNRVRRVKTGDDIVINHDDIAADKMSAQQLAMIGRGAIGGYRENELRRDSSNEDSGTPAGSTDSPDRTHSFVGLLNRKTELDLEKAQGEGENSEFNEKRSMDPAADHEEDDGNSSSSHARPCEEIDGIEDYEGNEEHFDPSCDYLGDNCIEMKRYKQKLAAQKLAKSQKDSPDDEKRMQQEEQDIGEAPMDRDIICGNIQPEDQDELCRDDHEGQAHSHHSRAEKEGEEKEGEEKEGGKDGKWPRHRDWVEGHDLVLEYQKSYSDDPVVEVIHLSDEERDAMESSSTPAHDWVKQHHDELGCYLGHDEHSSWDATQTARYLVENKVSSWWHKNKKKQYIPAEAPQEETRDEREARLNMMYGAMSWASDRRAPDEDIPKRQTRTEEPSSDSEDKTLDSSSAVVQTRQGGLGGAPIGPRDSSVPTGSTSAQDKSKRPSSSRRSSSSSRSPTPTATARVATAGRGGAGSIGSLGSKRGNLRKKVLCGQIGLSGRRKSSSVQDGDGEYNDSLLEDGSESEPSSADSTSIAASSTKSSASAPRVMISEPASPSHSGSKHSMRSSPNASFKSLGKSEAKGKDKEKFFPRSSSAGAGLAPSYRGSPLASGSPILKASAPPSRSRTSAGGLNTGETSDSAKENNRSSSIQWLDIADSRDRSQPYGHKTAEPDSPKMSRRTRTHSGATSIPSSSGDKELKREGRVRDPDEESDESVEEEDEEGDRSGGRGLRDGMSRIGAFFSNFTAPKGEGMGNPGPTSHPHLFPQHPPSRTKEEQEREKDRNRDTGTVSAPNRSPTSSRRLQREPTDEPESLSLPPASISESHRSAPRVMLNIPDQEEPVWPGRRSPA